MHRSSESIAAIASARRTIYLESQYFSAARVADALGRRLAEPTGPEGIIVNPKRAGCWSAAGVMGSARPFVVEGTRSHG